MAVFKVFIYLLERRQHREVEGKVERESEGERVNASICLGHFLLLPQEHQGTEGETAPIWDASNESYGFNPLCHTGDR